MIRTKHDIDTTLVYIFISENQFDKKINEALINWYSSLGDKDHQNTRNKAIDFLKLIAYEVLSEINYPIKERNDLIASFEPLELLLRTALSLNSYGDKPTSVRDHLSHTIRNILFTNYILKKFSPEDYSVSRRKLFIAAIFHDIAYPLEKLKKVEKKLGNKTFKDLLNSEGKIDIELSNTDDLLEMLDFIGRRTISELNRKIEEIKNRKEDVAHYIETREKIRHIYTEIIVTSIAGKGLFDISHSKSSVVLFLRPILKYWKDSGHYSEINLGPIADICLAMTYHDRENRIENIGHQFTIPLILRVMRISDELQEWDREYDSFIADVKIKNDPSSILSLDILMKDKKDVTCAPEKFIPHKIMGLLPALIKDEVIKLKFEFPREFQSSILKDELKGYPVSINDKVGKEVEVVFKNSQAIIQMI